MACLEATAARAFLGGLLRDFPRPPGPEEALPWSPPGGRGGRASPAEAPAELAELARSFLGGRKQLLPLPKDADCVLWEVLGGRVTHLCSEGSRPYPAKQFDAEVPVKLCCLYQWYSNFSDQDPLFRMALVLGPIGSDVMAGSDIFKQEVLSWNAPPLLAASLIHAAICDLLRTDLNDFKKQKVEGEEAGDHDTTPFLDGELLQRCFFNKLWEVCCKWQNQLPPLKPLQRYLQVSIHATRNTRRKMEDRHVSLPEFNQLFGMMDDVDRAFFAVFDGHGGIDAANYTATHLHVNLAHHKEILQNPEEALRDSFQKTDDMFLAKAKREKLRSGSTGVSALIVGDKLHIAWLGDSQVMLVQRGKAITLMEPHKPEREDEKQRIEALGGCVTYMDCWRVNGTLAVSRAIGDLFQKPYISGCADSASFDLTGAEDYVLLACDGFFDAIRPFEVVDLVLEHLIQSKGDGLKAAERLVAAAKESGSTDNITVLVAFLREPRDVLADCLEDPKSCPADDCAAEPVFRFVRSETNN